MNASRQRILEAADSLFRAQGYAGTSVEALASQADVAVQTIYNLFGSKRGVLAVLANGVSGYALDPRVRREADPVAVLRLVAGRLAAENESTAPLQAAVREAAAADVGLAALERRRRAERLDAYRDLARELQRRAALAAGLDVEDAAAAVSALSDPDAFRLLRERGWSPERYEQWLERSLRAQLLDVTRP